MCECDGIVLNSSDAKIPGIIGGRALPSLALQRTGCTKRLRVGQRIGYTFVGIGKQRNRPAKHRQATGIILTGLTGGPLNERAYLH
jgi:hypothetical protein